jgi:predicted dehydrogenase
VSAAIRLGAIGVDTSHLPEFTRRINSLNDSGQTRCRVMALWDPGEHDVPRGAEWLKQTCEMGVESTGSCDELLDRVDGVLVLSVNGRKHFMQTAPALERGLPTYVDKPLTCDLGEAKQLLALARTSGARCYSASSLRFAAEVTSLDRAALGMLHAIDAFGPGNLLPAMPGLFFYGCHTIEMVDALWGPGVKRVSAIHLEDRDLVDLDYHDGRYARLRLDRKSSYAFGATVHGGHGVAQFKVDFADVYNRLIKGMLNFFDGGPEPASLRDIVENVAVMEAGNESMARDGAWVDVLAIE